MKFKSVTGKRTIYWVHLRGL